MTTDIVKKFAENIKSQINFTVVYEKVRRERGERFENGKYREETYLKPVSRDSSGLLLLALYQFSFCTPS